MLAHVRSNSIIALTYERVDICVENTSVQHEKRNTSVRPLGLLSVQHEKRKERNCLHSTISVYILIRTV